MSEEMIIKRMDVMKPKDMKRPAEDTATGQNESVSASEGIIPMSMY